MLWAREFIIYNGCEGRSRSKRVTKGVTGSSKAPGAALGMVEGCSWEEYHSSGPEISVQTARAGESSRIDK